MASPNSLSLRKAAQLRSKLEKRLAELEVQLTQTSVNVNINDPNIIEQIDARCRELEPLYARYTALSEALRLIRSDIGDVNTSSGISALLASANAFKLRERVLVNLTSAPLRLSDEVVKARVAGAKATGSGSRYAPSPEMLLDVITPEFQASLKTELHSVQGALVRIHDKLDHENVVNTIDLDEPTHILLVQESLV